MMRATYALLAATLMTLALTGHLTPLFVFVIAVLMDALKLRRKNIVRRFPHRSAVGLSIEQGSFGRAIDLAVEAAGGFKLRQRESRKRGRLRGIGYACFLETARGQPNEVAELQVTEEGHIDIKVGTHSNGQGHDVVERPADQQEEQQRHRRVEIGVVALVDGLIQAHGFHSAGCSAPVPAGACGTSPAALAATPGSRMVIQIL